MELDPTELFDKAMDRYAPPKSAREALVLACIMVILAPTDETAEGCVEIVNGLSAQFDLPTIEGIKEEVDSFIAGGEFVMVSSVVGEA
tara:strand:- start:330 stop:593 length:264 start_codon:yes stop_codon:yes gene_type:complete